MKRYFNSFLDKPIEYLKGVGPSRAEVIKKERGIFNYGDLLYDFPFRYDDRTKITPIGQVFDNNMPVQIRGVLKNLQRVGQGKKQRLVGFLEDESGSIELVWFRGAKWLEQSLNPGRVYLAYGRLNSFKGKLNMPHPEMEIFDVNKIKKAKHLAPVYSSTEKLSAKGFDHKGRRKIMQNLFKEFKPEHIEDNLPPYLLKKLRLCNRYNAFLWIHFPENEDQLKEARRRLKFEELFFIQLVMIRSNLKHKKKIRGHVFEQVGSIFHQFYEEELPFQLTGAQKKVLKEIRKDLRTGIQMNRLLQGDVGSGKTVVGLMSMLMAIDNGFQACLMAPTEILAQQHYNSIQAYVNNLPVKTGFLSGSVKGSARREILEQTASGEMNILIGTHALIEPNVEFKNLGLAITDEQHRFGVKQRASLWKKNEDRPPHILVMTATPIPRTLAMTLYGDLDVSIIDELPPGRKPVHTSHLKDGKRMEMYAFIRKQIHEGRQAYVVYPLIEESSSLDLRDLTNGFDRLLEYFPRPQYQISMVHGQMKADEKEAEMQKFVEGKTQIMVATTVIEVGVNVPNATIMVIENAERFGLSQLHQLRGRVGRGADQSYCLLMSSHKLSHDAIKRIATMCETNDGFEIAQKDLELRGPGEMAGTRQSGDLGLKLADLSTDQELIKTARRIAGMVLDHDMDLKKPENEAIAHYLRTEGKSMQVWSFIS